MTTDRAPQHSFVFEDTFGAVLAHGDMNGRSDAVMAMIPATIEEHQLILNRLPRLAVVQGLNLFNAQRLLDLAATPDYDPSEAWIQANQPEQAA